MAIDCQTVANEELKRLRDIQRLLQKLCIALYGTLDDVGLEQQL